MQIEQTVSLIPGLSLGIEFPDMSNILIDGQEVSFMLTIDLFILRYSILGFKE